VLKKIDRLFLITLVMVIFFCGSNFVLSQEANRTLNYTFGWPAYIDPGVGSDDQSLGPIINLYDPLIYPKIDGEPGAHVAKSWEISDDGLVWTFYLREGIKFHDGSELTAEDVKFSMDRLATRGQGYGFLYSDRIKQTKVIDKYTVEFHLTSRFAPLLSSLQFFFILNKDLVLENIQDGRYEEFGDYGEKYLNLNAAGSGPYKLKEFDYGSHITFEQNPDYWLPLDPNCPDEIKFYAGLPTSTVKIMFEKRELEYCGHDLSMEALKTIDAIEGVDIGDMEQGAVMYGMLNNKKAPTDDIHIRKAMAWALDYKVIIEKIFPGFVQARGPASHNLPGFDPTVFQYYKDLDKAKEELEKSKYYGELDKYPITIHWTAELEDMEKLCLLLANDLNKIGLNVEIVKTPWVSVVEQCGSFETSPNMTLVSVAPAYPEVGAVFESRYHSNTVRSWEQNEWLSDPELDKKIEKAIEIADREERFKAYSELQHYFTDQCVSLFLYDRIHKVPYQSYYMEWALSDDSINYSINGYNCAGRFIKIYPEKRLELLNK
jgi:peptide/nickel transport system substrate-binding protein